MPDIATSEIVNVICIKWGSYYSADYVNNLYRAVVRNFKRHEVRFFCFTEHPEGIDPQVVIKPLPELKGAKFAYLKEAGLCDDHLGGLEGQRVIYFDLDSVICGELDRLLDFMTGDQPYITRDYGRNSDSVGGSNIYSWVVGSLGYIKNYYEENSGQVVNQFGTASQEYLSAKIIEKHGSLSFYPNEWHISFKKHCLRKWPMNFLKEARRPGEGVFLVNFHGDPKIHDAVSGSWSTRRKFPLYKRIYKYTKPVSWIKDYWY